MASFSVSQAIGSGFRLIGREPSAALVWLLAYLVYAVLVWGLMLAAAPELFGQYLALGRSGVQASSPQVQELVHSMGRLMAVAPVMLLLGLAFHAVFLGAIYRAVLQPDARRMAYLRFGRQELWLLLSLLVWALLSMVIYMAIIMGVSLLAALVGGGAAAAGAGQGAVLITTGVGIVAGLVLTVWIVMRLALSLPMSFEGARFVVFGGWTVTKGQAGKVLLVALGLVCIMVLLDGSVMAAFYVGAAAVGVDARTLAQAGGIGRMAPLLIAWAAIVSVLGVAFYVILAAPAADIYRQLKGEDVSVF